MQGKEKNTSGGVMDRLFGMAEFCKVILILACGYSFCFLFFMDQSIEGMNVFHRESTTSVSGLQHPVLYGIYLALIGFSLFLNIGHLSRRYQLRSKLVTVCQYVGLFALVAVALFKTNPERSGMSFYIHLAASILYAVGNGFGAFFFTAFAKKRYPGFRPFFYGGIIFIVGTVTGFIIRLCGFMETVPMLIVLVALYMANFTNLVPPDPNNETAGIEEAVRRG